MPQSTLAIVPAFNEAASVADVIRRIDSSGLGFDVLVVDDGSRDSTAEIARGAGASVVELPYNLGIGGAVQTGYRYALEHDYDFAIQIDGDGQHDPGEAARLLDRINAEPRVGMVYGTRFSEIDGFKSTSFRRMGIKLFATTLSLVTGQKVTDPTSGFRLCDRHAIKLFATDYPTDYPEVEAIMLMHRHKLRSAEVPVQMSERSGGTSSITILRSGYYMVKVLLAVLIGLFRTTPKVKS
jgi:glycosyltransferase involved in cell wall biosynthesis